MWQPIVQVVRRSGNAFVQVFPLLLMLSSCSALPHEIVGHPWQVSSRSLPDVTWEHLPKDRILPIPSSLHQAVLERLRDEPCFALSAEEERAIIETGLSLPDNTRLFAVRGCSYGESPDFAVVRQSKDKSLLHVHQGTAEAELFYPTAPTTVHASPLIVALRQAPERVFITADRGGDRVFRGWREMEFLPERLPEPK